MRPPPWFSELRDSVRFVVHRDTRESGGEGESDDGRGRVEDRGRVEERGRVGE